MARSRNIKPGFYKNEDLAECSIWARFIFPGLWMLADREGRLEDRPKRIKGELLPFDSQDMEPLLRELAAKLDAKGNPFIIRYEVDGVRYIQITKFKDHQSPHYTEKESVIKPPPLQEKGSDICDDSKKPPGIKGVSKPPDSLIPDSGLSDSPKPDSPKKEARKRAIRPDGVSEKVWGDFTEIRRAKRAPLTETALAGIEREAGKAGMTLQAALETACARGWQGFEAAWVNQNEATNGKRFGGNGTWAEQQRSAARRAILHPAGAAERDITGDSERVDRPPVCENVGVVRQGD